MSEDIPVRLATRWTAQKTLDERNQRENRKRATKLEPAPKACQRIEKQRSANKRRIRTWLGHPDGRVAGKVLARATVFMESSGLGNIQTWSHSQLIRKRLIQEIERAQSEGVYWTPVLDKGWKGNLIYKIRASTCGRSGRLDIQDQVEEMLEQLGQWARQAPISQSRALFHSQNRHIQELMARSARLEAEDIERLFERLDSDRDQRRRRHERRALRRAAPRAPGRLLADNPHLSTPELFLCVEKSHGEPEALTHLLRHPAADRQVQLRALEQFPGVEHPAAAHWMNKLLSKPPVRGNRALEEKLAQKAPWSTIQRVLEGHQGEYPAAFVRQGARKNQGKISQWARQQTTFREGVAPILLSELHGDAQQDVLRQVGRAGRGR